MLQLFRFAPAWGLPCISPFVTKVAYYLRMTGHTYDLVNQDLTTLATDSPSGKLPYIIDVDGTKIDDSGRIIRYLKQTYGDPFDAQLTPQKAAQALAWRRLCEEHLYWCGMVAPRWRSDAAYTRYVPYLTGLPDPPPEVLATMENVRANMLNQLDGQGMGRRSDDDIFERFCEDIHALEAGLGEQPFLLGHTPHTIDVVLCAFVQHILKVPFAHRERNTIATKVALINHATRMCDRFDLH